MSTATGGGWLANRRFDRWAAGLGLLFAVVTFPLRFLVSQFYIVTLPVVLGVACIVYLLAAYGSDEHAGLPRWPGWAARLAPTLVVLLASGMILVAALANARTILFFDLAGVAATLVVLQVVLDRPGDLHGGVLLLQIVVLAVVVRFAALYTTHGLIGIDVWTHVRVLAASIRRAHSLTAISGNKYFAAPLYHLLVVTAGMAYDTTLRNGLYLSLGLAMPFACLLVYGTARYLVGTRWAILAAAVYAVADQAIRWSLHLIPTSLGLLFFLGVLYFVVRLLHTDYRYRDLGMLVFLSTAVVLTHQISSFIMLVLVGAGLVAQVVVRFDAFTPSEARAPLLGGVSNTVNLAGLFVFDLGLSTFMWSLTPYQGDTFLVTVFSFFRQTLVQQAGFLNLAGPDSTSTAAAAGSVGQPHPFLDTLVTYVDHGGLLVLLVCGAVGSLAVLRRARASQTTYTLIVAVVTMLVFVFGLPLFGVRSFVPGRWIAFLYAPLVVLTVAGFAYAVHRLPAGVLAACLLLFAVLLPGVMLISGSATLDDPVFESQHTRYAYTESELAAVHTIGATRPPGGLDTPLYTDHPYQAVFTRTRSHFARPIPLSRNGRPIINNTVDTLVYRRYQTHGGPYFQTAADTGVIATFPERAVCPRGLDHVYANGDVTECVVPGQSGAT